MPFHRFCMALVVLLLWWGMHLFHHPPSFVLTPIYYLRGASCFCSELVHKQLCGGNSYHQFACTYIKFYLDFRHPDSDVPPIFVSALITAV